MTTQEINIWFKKFLGNSAFESGLKVVMSNPVKKGSVTKVVITRNSDQSSSSFTKSEFLNDQCFTAVLTKEELDSVILDAWNQYKQTTIMKPAVTIQLLYNGKGKGTIKQADATNTKLFTKVEKSYPIPKETPFLQHLGVTSSQGQVKASMQGKFRQINKFVEIIQSTVKQSDLNGLNIYDFGCGKGYLTMGLHHLFAHKLKQEVTTTGIDLKKKVIEDNQVTAQACGYTDIQFRYGDITNVEVPNGSMMIALHACDIATDIAIHKGIVSQAKYIVVSPCCHKQVRRSMVHQPLTKPITSHGILLERQAEILTDTIRCLLLEQYGYRTDIFEFVSTEHTSKNLMIRAVYTGNKKDNKDQIDNLMKTFGIDSPQYLERLLSA
jgi:hypothetical protein